MSLATPTVGCSPIHGELLKLGIDVGQTSVAKYMTRRRRPQGEGHSSATTPMGRCPRRSSDFLFDKSKIVSRDLRRAYRI
jgi:hypothetical protein